MVHHSGGFRLQRNARIAQLVFLPLNGPDATGYAGVYQGEKLVIPPSETTVEPAELRRMVDQVAAECGFDLVSVASAEKFTDDRDAALRRIDDGLMDGLLWFTKSRVRRGADPQELLPGARSIVSVGWNYYAGAEPETAAGQGLIARYARGRDYHRVMKRRMRRMTLELSHRLGSGFAARWYVDDGPMLDRAAAARAGLGWFGKNGNILNSRYGSWLLLGQIITDLPLTPDAPLRKTCGQCARCIPACPTDAIIAPYVVDNRRCISYLTIEHKGAIPLELRPAMGNWVFGCDICQEVCPVNRKAKATADPNFGRRDLSSVDLIELLDMSEDTFRQRFAGTPVMRAKRVGMQRNACIALGNLGDPEALPALVRALRFAAPLVRQHAAWALGRIGGADARAALTAAGATEDDPAALAEIELALAEAGRP